MMPTNKKITQVKKENWKIFNFFCEGEFLTSVDARNKKQAIELFKSQDFKETDCDLIISYEHKTERYCIQGVIIK